MRFSSSLLLMTTPRYSPMISPGWQSFSSATPWPSFEVLIILVGNTTAFEKLLFWHFSSAWQLPELHSIFNSLLRQLVPGEHALSSSGSQVQSPIESSWRFCWSWISFADGCISFLYISSYSGVRSREMISIHLDFFGVFFFIYQKAEYSVEKWLQF